MRTLKLFLLFGFALGVFALVCWIAVALSTIVVSAQEAPKWMEIRPGALGLNFVCSDTMPYTLDHPMIWDDQRGAIELDEYGTLMAQVIKVEDCYLDNIYQYQDRFYAWRFTDDNTDAHPSHRHLTRGAWWIIYPLESESGN